MVIAAASAVPTQNQNTHMRMRVVWAGFCLGFLVLLGACSKSSEADKLPPMEFEGVKVDTPRLMAEFVNAPPPLQTPVNDAATKVRYKLYLEAMMELDEVLKSPGLNDKQKKLIAQVLDQLKEVIAKVPPRPNR
jgi:hypothetical protein